MISDCSPSIINLQILIIDAIAKQSFTSNLARIKKYLFHNQKKQLKYIHIIVIINPLFISISYTDCIQSKQ